jgi:FkbM family methyltransferase
MLFSKFFIEKNLCKFPLAYANLRTLCGAEDWEKQIFLKTIRPGWTIIDIGANLGYFTNLFQTLVGTNGQVHAFEPVPSTFKQLQSSLPKGSNHCTLYNFGTAKEAAEVIFHIPMNDHGQATMYPHDCKTWKSREIEEVLCSVIKLDEFLPISSLTKIDFIKIDVEGAELPSLQGAESILSKHKPLLFVEVCKAWMKSFGYNIKELEAFLRSLSYNKFEVVGRNLLIIDSMESFLKSKGEEDSFNFLIS